MGDFNPGFQFDFGDGAAAAQPAWEFSGALEQARMDPVHGTSIDHKISQRVQRDNMRAASLAAMAADKAAKAGKAGGKATGKAAAAAAAGVNGKRSREQRDSDGEEEEEDSDDEDAPLPGEVDDDEDGDEELLGDDDDEEEEEEEEEEKPAARGKQQQQQTAAGQKGAKAAAPGEEVEFEEEFGDDDDEDEDEGDGDEEEQEEQVDDDEEDEEEEEEPPSTSGRDAAATARNNKARDPKRKVKGAKPGFYSETPEGTTYSSASFADLNISRPLLKAVEALGYKTPTPIQAACIPLALAGRDICGSAVTGSGKTAAFALPFLERLLHRPRGLAATYVLVMTPTRELAVQIHSMIEKLAQFSDVTVALIVGGLSLQVQAATLRKLPEVVVATPGRLLDHLRNSQSVGLEDLAVLVLDEADRLLEMGFREEVSEVVRMAPRKRQTMLFSATFNDQVRDLVSLSLKQPVRLAADAALAAPKLLTQEIVRLKGPAAAASKEAVCLALCGRSFGDRGRTIVFCSTKTRAHRLKILFGLAGLPPAAELHGNMSQTARLESLESFRRGETAFLLATDVAARGLDIQGVEVVVNFDAPPRLETYLHRIGRTARAGLGGVAVTLVEDGDRNLLKELGKKGGFGGVGVALKQRVVAAPTVAQWQGRIERMERDVWAIMKEERDEADLRKAEMEHNKISNMLEHEDEIKARPKRTWFVTERQKKELQKRSAEAGGREEGGGEEGDDDGQGGSAEDAKRAKSASKTDKRMARKLEAAKEAKEKAKGKQRSEDPDQRAAAPKVRSIKTLARELAQEHGITSTKAAKMAAHQITGLSSGSKKKKAKKAKLAAGSDGDGGTTLFAGDGLNTARPGKISLGAGSAAAADDSFKSVGRFGGKLKSQLSKTEKNQLKRGGKGKSSFKSKSRFKRR